MEKERNVQKFPKGHKHYPDGRIVTRVVGENNVTTITVTDLDGKSVE